MRTDMQDDVDTLFDYLTNHRDGVTLSEISHATGWSHGKAKTRISHLRLIFGDDNENLVCTPDGLRNQWRYKLTGNYEEARDWLNNRERDMSSRLTTVLQVAKSIKAGTPAGTVNGKRARLTVKVIGRLIEDLAEIA